MSKRTRRNFNPDFKAKVAIEALKEQHTLSELASKYNLHPNQISDWKKQILASSASVFEGSRKPDEPSGSQQEMDDLYKAIGQLKMENDWLKKKSDQLFGKGWQDGIGK